MYCIIFLTSPRPKLIAFFVAFLLIYIRASSISTISSSHTIFLMTWIYLIFFSCFVVYQKLISNKHTTLAHFLCKYYELILRLIKRATTAATSRTIQQRFNIYCIPLHIVNINNLKKKSTNQSFDKYQCNIFL